jgi:hypothetical protein
MARYIMKCRDYFYIYPTVVGSERPPLWYRVRDPGFDSRRYKIFLEVVGLQRGPLSLVRIAEELLDWKNNGSGSRKST